MIFGIICFLVSIFGIIGYYNESFTITYIAFVLCLLENIFGRITGESKTMQFFIISCIIGWIATEDFKLGIAIGACFENVIAFIGGIIMILLFSNNTNVNHEENNFDTSITILEETIKNAKSDLTTGVKKEELDKLLRNGHITQETYNEVLNNIKMLEAIANLDIDELKKNSQK